MSLIEIIKDLGQAIADGGTWYDTYIVADLNDGELFVTHDTQSLNNAQVVVNKVNPYEDFISYINPETGNVDPAEVEGFSLELQELEGEYWETAEEEFEHELYVGTGATPEAALEEVFAEAITNTPRRVADQLSVLIEYDADDEEYSVEVSYTEPCMMTCLGFPEGAVEDYFDAGVAKAAENVMWWYEMAWIKGTPEYKADRAEINQ